MTTPHWLRTPSRKRKALKSKPKYIHPFIVLFQFVGFASICFHVFVINPIFVGCWNFEATHTYVRFVFEFFWQRFWCGVSFCCKNSECWKNWRVRVYKWNRFCCVIDFVASLAACLYMKPFLLRHWYFRFFEISMLEFNSCSQIQLQRELKQKGNDCLQNNNKKSFEDAGDFYTQALDVIVFSLSNINCITIKLKRCEGFPHVWIINKSSENQRIWNFWGSFFCASYVLHLHLHNVHLDNVRHNFVSLQSTNIANDFNPFRLSFWNFDCVFGFFCESGGRARRWVDIPAAFQPSTCTHHFGFSYVSSKFEHFLTVLNNLMKMILGRQFLCKGDEL